MDLALFESPAATGDIGNWLEPLGLASLLVETTVLLLVVQRLSVLRETQSM